MKRWFVIIGCCVVWMTATAQEIRFSVSLDSSDTGSGSTGRGTGYLILSSDRSSLQYHIVVNKLVGSITAAHFHLLPSGIPVHTITFTGGEAAGTWMLPDSVFNYLFSGRVYINVHTSAFSGGEVRGWPQPQQFGFRIDLNGAQANTASTGRGAGYIRLNENNGANTLTYRITYAGLHGTITGAHFHALPGGGVVHTLTFVDSTAEGEWTSVPDSVWWKLVNGQIYANIHTTFAGTGEIRGTAQPVGEAPFIGQLDGSQAVTLSTGQGTVWAVLRPDRSLRYSATYNRLGGSFSAAHFHETRTGNVVQGVTFSANHASGTWSSLGDQTIADLFQGRLYLNIHSSTNTGGEIRANMSFYDGVVTGELSGSAAGTASSGRGTIWGRFQEDSLDYNVTIAGLSSAYAGSHFHIAPTGTLLFSASMSDSVARGYWVYGDRFVDLLRGNIYFSVHSVNFADGELRADLKIGTGIATGADQEVPPVPVSFDLLQNYPNPFNPTTLIGYSIAQAGRFTLEVFDLLGRRVAVLADGVLEPGSYQTSFDASGLPTGIYLYRLSGEHATTVVRRMVLIK